MRIPVDTVLLLVALAAVALVLVASLTLHALVAADAADPVPGTVPAAAR